jgi:C-terminal processing protease CtpA/Prc
MKKTILASLSVFFLFTAYCQNREKPAEFNFDFEIVENQSPVDWNVFGSSEYIHALDSVNVKSGKYSAYVEFADGNQDFKAWAYTIPHSYAGRKITLSGYIKTENVTDGYAGLWMRIDPSVAFDNMQQHGVKGTTDWTKYDITLVMNPDQTEKIVIGGLLVGKGKMWIDGLNVSIDGKDISKAKIYNPKQLTNQRYREFDKGSQISIASVNEQQIENLKTLGLIWGFLKYYHPNIAKGDYNWDYELFIILPEVLNSESRKHFDDMMIKWINNLGRFAQGKETVIESSLVKNMPDLDWIMNSGFSDELTQLLLTVKNSKRTNKHYYVNLYPFVGNPEFKNENAYAIMKYPDTGFRLLSLYRYWNIIQYYFPYKNLIEEDWKDVLGEFIPVFVNAGNETVYVLAVLELIGRVHDTHANIWGGTNVKGQYFGLRFAPVMLTFIEEKAVVTKFIHEKSEKESGLKIGDIILFINDRPVEEIVKERLKYYPASNYPTKLRDIALGLLRSNDSIIKVEFLRNDRIESKTLKTFTIDKLNFYENPNQPADSCFKLINDDIAYLNHRTFKRKYLTKIWKKIEHSKGLIIDIRNGISDNNFLHHLSRYLMPVRSPFTKVTTPDIKNPGLFTFTKTIYVGKRNKNFYKGKVVILINENTQSSAEFHTMAYRVHPNSIVVGSTTAAADGNVSVFFLPGGIKTFISGIGIYYPDGRETQRIGIVPDIEIKPTIQGIREGRDEVLEKAIEIINE